LVSDELSPLATKYGTDKGIHVHNYTPFYNEHLSSIRKQVTKVLEIGVLDGASLRMWKDYFPQAIIYGIDLGPRPNYGERIKTFVANQANRGALQKFIDTYGGEFDLIIDDGGHHHHQQQISFGFLFQFVKPDGYYIIEDLQYSFVVGTRFGPPEANTYDMLRKLQSTGETDSSFLQGNEVYQINDLCHSCYFYEWESPITKPDQTRSSRLHIACIIKRKS
jgi:hypothetical protein